MTFSGVTHVHTAYSLLDAIGYPESFVKAAVDRGHKHIAMVEHGHGASWVEGYQAAKKYGINFTPGVEAYLVKSVAAPPEEKTAKDITHLILYALNERGWVTLSRLITKSYEPDHFHRRPLIDLNDLSELHEQGLTKDLAVTTACISGMAYVDWQMDDDGGRAERFVKLLHKWFGNNTYVELHYHNIPDGHDGIYEENVAVTMYNMAKRLNLPVIVGCDCHYVDDTQQPEHNLYKSVAYKNTDFDNGGFSGGPYHLKTREELYRPFPLEWHDDLDAGHQRLHESSNVVIPILDNYKMMMPRISSNPDEELAGMVWKAFDDSQFSNDDYYRERVEHELDILSKVNYSEYIILTTRITNFMLDNNIAFNARGSVNGSLVLYLLGVTRVDPVRWNIDFSRFASLDRKSPADCDLDVAAAQAEDVVNYIKDIMPGSERIGTIAFGKAYLKPNRKQSGTLAVKYQSMTKDRDADIPPHHWEMLKKIGDDGVAVSWGQHAAGVVIPGDDHPVDKYLQIGTCGKDRTRVTTMEKNAVEALGYVKFDILKLATLTTVSECLRRIGKDTRDWSWIPYDDPATLKMICDIETDGVFQLEGWSTQQGLKKFKPTNTWDVILAIALFRGSMLTSGLADRFCKNVHLPYEEQDRVPAYFDDIFGDYLGVAVTQDTVIQTLRKIEMPVDDLNKLLKAIKASNGNIGNAQEVINGYKPLFSELCANKGLTHEETESIWEVVAAQGAYSLPLSHCVAYGLLSYITAYLKRHYPTEYFTALLNSHVDSQNAEKKLETYTRSARRMGVYITNPDINESGVFYEKSKTADHTIRKGLLAIKGIGEKTAQEILDKRPEEGWKTLSEAIEACTPRLVTGGKMWAKKRELTGAWAILRREGVLSSLGIDPIKEIK